MSSMTFEQPEQDNPNCADTFASLRLFGDELDPMQVTGLNGLKAADVRLEQTYTIAYIAHAPLEPRAGVAQWDNGQLTVWTGTQRPFGVRSELARAFGLPEGRVRVVVPDTGSGYGGNVLLGCKAAWVAVSLIGFPIVADAVALVTNDEQFVMFTR